MWAEPLWDMSGHGSKRVALELGFDQNPSLHLLLEPLAAFPQLWRCTQWCRREQSQTQGSEASLQRCHGLLPKYFSLE